MKRIQCAIGACMLGLASASVLADRLYLGTGVGDNDNYKGYAGYQLSEHFAVEAVYRRTDNFVRHDLTGDNLRYEGVQTCLVGILPLSDRSALLGKIGAFSWNATEHGDDAGSGHDSVIGLGYQYKFGADKRWAAGVEFESFSDIGIAGAYTLTYQF